MIEKSKEYTGSDPTKPGRLFTAFFDEAEGFADSKANYLAIASVVVPNESEQSLLDKSIIIWQNYLPTTPFKEFHSTDMERYDPPFSEVKGGDTTKMQKDFIQLLEVLDLSVYVVGINTEQFKETSKIASYSSEFDGRIFAGSLFTGFIAELAIDGSGGDRCKLITDKGLLRKDLRKALSMVIAMFPESFGAEVNNIFRAKGFAAFDSLNNFPIESEVEELDSDEKIGIQLADHAARYVFRHKARPQTDCPQYLSLLESGLRELPPQTLQGAENLMSGIDLFVRPKRIVKTPVKTYRGFATPSQLQEIIVPELEITAKKQLGTSHAKPPRKKPQT